MAIPTNTKNSIAAEAALTEKLHKVEALLAGATTQGERDAAQAARERIQVRLRELANQGILVEMPFRFDDEWTLRLFRAVCRRNGLTPYCKPRQRRYTVMVQVNPDFLNGAIWWDFVLLTDTLKGCLNEATFQFIQAKVFTGMEDFESW